MSSITEIAENVFRISTFISDGNIQMNQFLIKDDEPLLWHTGQKYLFNEVRAAIAKIIYPGNIRWIGFSHFESDECGSLNEWLNTAPQSEAFCSFVGANVNMNDFAVRRVRGFHNDEIIKTGKYSFRFISTPHLPHGWDSGLLFEETLRTLFCSDLFHQPGNPTAITGSDIIESVKNNLVESESGPFNSYMPYTTNTEMQLNHLAELKPNTLAVMHGSSFTGDCEKSLLDLAYVMKNVLG